MLKSFTIESKAGFELNLELTVKAFLAGHAIAEIPTTWRNRTAGRVALSRLGLAAAIPEVVFLRLPTQAPVPRSPRRGRHKIARRFIAESAAVSRIESEWTARNRG